jgi:hypothetical protein
MSEVPVVVYGAYENDVFEYGTFTPTPPVI